MANLGPAKARSRGPRRTGPTRDLLVQAAVELLLAEGVDELSASRIAAAASIAQPNFYVYFENLDDCTRAAAEIIAGRVRAFIASNRAESFPVTAKDVDLEASIRGYQAILRLSEGGAPGATFLRLRGDDSVVGEVMRKLVREMCMDLAEDLWKLAESQGVDRRAKPQLDLLAEMNVATVLAAATALLEERAPTVAKTARVLAVSTIASFGAVIEDLSAPRSGRGR